MVEQAEVLEYNADAAAQGGEFLARRVGDIVVEDADQTAGWPMRQVQQAQQRGLVTSRSTSGPIS
jgi:hypothetical protein